MPTRVDASTPFACQKQMGCFLALFAPPPPTPFLSQLSATCDTRWLCWLDALFARLSGLNSSNEAYLMYAMSIAGESLLLSESLF
jgi:hypothetical protein